MRSLSNARISNRSLALSVPAGPSHLSNRERQSMKKMLDGFRRLAIVLALVFLLTPLAKPMAGIISEGKSRTVLADNSSATSAPHGNHTKVAVTPQARAEAEDIFESRCVACHGPEGRGDGPAASNLNPKPRDFHNRKWQKSIDDATIARAIVY